MRTIESKQDKLAGAEAILQNLDSKANERIEEKLKVQRWRGMDEAARALEKRRKELACRAVQLEREELRRDDTAFDQRLQNVEEEVKKKKLALNEMIMGVERQRGKTRTEEECQEEIKKEAELKKKLKKAEQELN